MMAGGKERLAGTLALPYLRLARTLALPFRRNHLGYLTMSIMPFWGA